MRRRFTLAAWIQMIAKQGRRFRGTVAASTAAGVDRYSTLICLGSDTTISGLPAYAVIFPLTQMRFPL